ncbi:hypothetical protein [uncultured Mucilaginibacter sp.]|uniref:hypothetical protein n=1 Tax=uncultured Mucilaginibacter sp. TaxID=797541 RepID=UPI0025F97A8B|nr:hypothetical protein [uncultured Mucilaginibacter sp.]
MRRILIILIISFLSKGVFAQGTPDTSQTAPFMTTTFTDSLTKEIKKIMPAHYSIKLFYTTSVSAEGKLLQPKIKRETANGTIEDNNFVVNLRLLIMAAPAWKPAFDKALNKTIDSRATFYIIIHNGNVKIDLQGEDDEKFRTGL